MAKSERITLGDYLAVLIQIVPAMALMTQDMLRDAAEEGKFPAWRNPLKDDSWWFLVPDAHRLHDFHIKALKIEKAASMRILEELKLNFNQQRLKLVC